MEEKTTNKKAEFDDLLKIAEEKVGTKEQPKEKERQEPIIPKADKKPTKAEPEPKEEPKQEASQKPYVHINVFLQTAIGYFKMSTIQAQGFKSRMNGRHYQRDEQVFVDELKKYLNIK